MSEQLGNLDAAANTAINNKPPGSILVLVSAVVLLLAAAIMGFAWGGYNGIAEFLYVTTNLDIFASLWFNSTTAALPLLIPGVFSLLAFKNRRLAIPLLIICGFAFILMLLNMYFCFYIRFDSGVSHSGWGKTQYHHFTSYFEHFIECHYWSWFPYNLYASFPVLLIILNAVGAALNLKSPIQSK